jgi:hypothetical protein
VFIGSPGKANTTVRGRTRPDRAETPGPRSRFGGTVHLPAGIFTAMADKQGYRLAPDLAEV